MKKIILSLSLGLSTIAFAQINVPSTPSQSVLGENVFLDASNYSTQFGWGTSEGKGLNFPQTDLTAFTFKTTGVSPSTMGTWFDGMVVYNTKTGNTLSGQGVVQAVTPGFYFFSNPTGESDGAITNGKWVRLGVDAATAAAAAKAWQQGGNATVANATDAIIGGTNATTQNVRFFANNVERMTIGAQSGVTVDAANFDFVLDVLGKARFRNGIVTEKSTYPDYVFEKYFTGSSKINPNYQFKSLAETEKFVKENNHLPGVTKITEFSKDGQKYLIDAAELSVQNLEKVEELYLHTIQQQKEIDALKAEIAEIKASLKK